jgi:hypothetical protein
LTSWVSIILGFSFIILFVGPCPHRDRDYRIRSNFWKFYLIKTGFTLGELVFSFGENVETVYIGTDLFSVRTLDIVSKGTTSYLLAGPACL